MINPADERNNREEEQSAEEAEEPAATTIPEEIDNPEESPEPEPKATENILRPEAPLSNWYADREERWQWEQAFVELELSGDWAEDLLTIAGTQMGYTESSKNFEPVWNEETESYDLKGYTRYGDRL